mgnify:CR=1 FL=1
MSRRSLTDALYRQIAAFALVRYVLDQLYFLSLFSLLTSQKVIIAINVYNIFLFFAVIVNGTKNYIHLSKQIEMLQVWNISVLERGGTSRLYLAIQNVNDKIGQTIMFSLVIAFYQISELFFHYILDIKWIPMTVRT